MKYYHFVLSLLLVLFSGKIILAQEVKIVLSTEETHQTLTGFGASLAFYENWLTAHPNKNEIYEAIFNELSLDILRVRNAHGYDNGMVGRVKEFIEASETTQGRPIPFLSTSWGPPADYKSNNDRKNGGTLKYSVSDDGKVEFAYEDFADWWMASLDEYESNGIFPKWVSIQNEPDWKASYESCLFHYFELVNASDTLAGYNKALETVHASMMQRNKKAGLLGPETIGLGYNTFRYYTIQLDTSLIEGLAHHLYHGINPNQPWGSSDLEAASKLYPEIPHFQTEYSDQDCDWFELGAIIYQTLTVENAVAYFYWDLIWDKNGLVGLDNPWTSSSWRNSKGYLKNKEFYTFKQYSAFIHPGWQRIETSAASSDIKTLAFISPEKDSLSIVAINKSENSEKTVRFVLDDFEYNQSAIYITNEAYNCKSEGDLKDPVFTVPPQSISTAFFTSTNKTEKPASIEMKKTMVFPNPTNGFLNIRERKSNAEWLLLSLDGNVLLRGTENQMDCSMLNPGIYLLNVDETVIKIIKE